MMNDESDVWITTEDNPFDPFTQWNHWLNFDTSKGYNTCGKIYKLCPGNDTNLTEYENEQRVRLAIDDLVKIRVAIGNNGNVSQYILAEKGKTIPF